MAMALTKKQLALRQQYLWASEYVALFPEYAMPYQRSVLELYAEKTGMGSLREAKGKAIDAGNFWEDTIARAWAKENGYKLFKGQSEIRPDEFGFPLGATPDRIACKMPANKTRREGVEAKNIGLQDAGVWGEEPHGAAYHVLIQATIQTMVCKFPIVHIPICIGGNDRRCYEYEPQNELVQLCVERGKWFWEIVTTRAWHERLPELPEVHAEIKARFAAKLFQQNTEPPVAANEDDLVAFENYLALDRQKTEIENKMLEIRAAAALKMKNAGCIVGPDGKKLFYKKITPAAHVEPKPYYRKESIVVLANKPRMRAEVYDEIS